MNWQRPVAPAVTRIICLSLLLGVACTATKTATRQPSSSVIPSSPVIPNVRTAKPVESLASCPSPRSFQAITNFVHLNGAPDDLLAIPDGSLWVSDPDHGILWHLDSSGTVVQRFRDPHAPEGMVALPMDGSFLRSSNSTGSLRSSHLRRR
ncbi:MAG: hypothetical protein ACYDCC_07395 [Actinomycetota bacterium]